MPLAPFVPPARQPLAAPPPGAGEPVRVCLVGAGPRALGVLDRLAARAGGLDRPLVVHVVDPHPPGSGRVWRSGQHRLLWANSRAADVTVLPDATSTVSTPVRTGPSLHGWVEAHRDELVERLAAEGEPELAAEAEALAPGSFPSRALTGRYLAAAWRHVLDGLPAGVRVQVHADRVVDVLDEDADGTDGAARGAGAAAAPGRQLVRLAGGAELAVDAVLLAQGHPDVLPGPRERDLAAFAQRHGLGYVAPAYTGDLGLEHDLDAVRPGEDVLVAGMGLAFVDLLVLLTEGRGGRYEQGPDGQLVYRPCGAEPVLHVGSRRGVPYRSKITYELQRRPVLPRFFTVAAGEELAARRGPLSLRRDAWPLIAKELAGAHYGELFAGHPQRTRVPAAEFDAAFAAAAWGSTELDALVERAVPDPADCLDLARLDRPLAGWWSPTAEGVHERVRAHVAADVARRGDPAHSADAAVFSALLSCYGVVAALAARGLLDARSTALEVDGWWHGFFSYVASGPPPQRLRQLLALADAGVVRFLGGELRVRPDEQGRAWTARGGNGPVEVSARVLVDARLPSPTVRGAADPLLRALAARGEAGEREFADADGEVFAGGRLAVDEEGRVLHRDGTAHPRRFAAGPWVAGGGWAPAFPRPGLDAGFFRLNDALAGGLLEAALSAGEPAGASSAPPAGTRRAG
ncbi:FAD/NAD(P)-binding protein [Kineococcus gypseus]|uniref:FAD/NAD(P)-binding protein n=1 Tax=Kineococcus gypseus TaxID=1637102 RepID=UPI003D7EDA94